MGHPDVRAHDGRPPASSAGVAGYLFPSRHHPSGHIPGDMLGEWLCQAERREMHPLAGQPRRYGCHRLQRASATLPVGHPDLILPISPDRPWLVLTGIGTPADGCPGGEGGLRIDGSRDCTHAGASRYSLDFTDAEQWEGSGATSSTPEIRAAAHGIISDICLQPPSEVTCGPNGPFVLVEHGEGFRTIYAHLDPASVTLRHKTPVTQGQWLGRMGAWEADRAPWLHFELRYENQGATAAWVLDSVDLDGRRFTDYKEGDRRVR